jgi:hypothetical protein
MRLNHNPVCLYASWAAPDNPVGGLPSVAFLLRSSLVWVLSLGSGWLALALARKGPERRHATTRDEPRDNKVVSCCHTREKSAPNNQRRDPKAREKGDRERRTTVPRKREKRKWKPTAAHNKGTGRPRGRGGDPVRCTPPARPPNTVFPRENKKNVDRDVPGGRNKNIIYRYVKPTYI